MAGKSDPAGSSFASIPKLKTLALLTTVSLALGIATTHSSQTDAHDDGSGNGKILRDVLAREALPDIPGHVMTVVKVELPPGGAAAPHRHGGLVYAYMLEGRLQSQLDDDPPQDYSAGQSWIEPAGALHAVTKNLSETEPAKFLAVIISPDGTAISSPAETKGGVGN